jgi:SAM-dependent methyltransferase
MTLATKRYYESRAREYSDSTLDLDVRELYKPFIERLKTGAHILDAGCGSGRDTKFFLECGYHVTAIDASAEMVRLATEFTGQTCQVLSFQRMTFKEEFAGIWACASLLHVPKKEMRDVMIRFARSLRPSGVFYISLKEGDGESVSDDGRYFSFYTAESFREVIKQTPHVLELHFWKTS